MPDPSDSLNQSEIIRRLTALLLQLGGMPALEEDDCAAAWKQGVYAGLCAASAVAGGAGAQGGLEFNELAALGFDLAQAVDWSQEA
jgi:hypothetical protein